MAHKPDLNSEKPKRRRGRPSREDELRRAVAEFGVDPALVDPQRVLASIIIDVDVPASARVAACRELRAQREGGHSAEDSTAGAATSVNARAAAMMRRAN